MDLKGATLKLDVGKSKQSKSLIENSYNIKHSQTIESPGKISSLKLFCCC